MDPSLESLSSPYLDFLCQNGMHVSEPGGALKRPDLPDEQSLQILWLDRAFGNVFTDDQGRQINIIRPGTWNRCAGPDFLNAQLEIDGRTVEGDIELDCQPEDWERHGHGANPNFNNVVLHVACLASSKTWYTRNERHELVPHIVIPEDILRESIHSSSVEPNIAKQLPECRAFFSSMDEAGLSRFLQSVAAFRLNKKRRIWQQRCNASGKNQTLYECLAETLGYSANKANMRYLAKRAPLDSITKHPEAILFGTAGFLVPVLKETCDQETRGYHKDLWTFWWTNREEFELSEQRGFSWIYSGIRPANHPQRRLAALAILVNKWKEFTELCSLATGHSLIRFMTSLEHPYWSRHVTLPSAQLAKPLALIGKDRALDFIINHVATMDESPKAWDDYLALPGSTLSSKVIQTAALILPNEQLARKLTRKAYQQQALLQMHQDFCGSMCPNPCPLPRQADHWGD